MAVEIGLSCRPRALAQATLACMAFVFGVVLAALVGALFCGAGSRCDHRGQWATHFQLFGMRGYEACGVLGGLLGFGIGTVCGALAAERLTRRSRASRH